MEYLCNDCPRRCGAARTRTQAGGVCLSPALPRVVRAAPHFGEEPCISGTRGSGAVFFSGCSLRCVFCQNREISRKSVGQTLIRAAFCGVMVYLSVCIYRDQRSPLGILFCIPTFVLSGFEHSIADLFYAAAGCVSGPMAVFILAVLAGNAAGGLLLPALARPRKKEKPV